MTENSVQQSPKGSGCGPLTFFIVLVVIAILIFGGNEAFGWYGINCGGMDIFECAQEIMAEEEAEENTVTAAGSYSYKDYSIKLTALIPLEGGEVSGTVTGDCNGKLAGNFDGKNNGKISGNIAGTCTVFFVNVPAKATYNGSVNKDSKNIPITFQGSGGGFSHSDSMTLSY